MKTVTITEANALAAYKIASPENKTFLTALMPDVLKMDIRDRVKTWEDVCGILGIDPIESIPFDCDTEKGEALSEEESANADFKLKKMVRVLNEGWVPDYSDEDEYKYYPRFYLSGGGFSFHACAHARTSTGVGARLSFKSRELCEYAAKQFLDIYRVALSM